MSHFSSQQAASAYFIALLETIHDQQVHLYSLNSQSYGQPRNNYGLHISKLNFFILGRNFHIPSDMLGAGNKIAWQRESLLTKNSMFIEKELPSKLSILIFPFLQQVFIGYPL